jgi:DNA-binding response OmpR family regulator
MANPSHRSIKGIKIVLVESRPDQKKDFLDLAGPEGCPVFTCDSTIEAIQWIKKNDVPQLLIIEEGASPMDGFQTFDFIQSELKLNLPVLIATAKDPISTNNKKELLGFIDKPFSEHTISLIKSFLLEQKKSRNLDQKLYSLDYLKNLSGGNEDFIITSLHLFNDSVRDKLAEIKEALAKNEFTVVREIAHNIKPSFEMLESNTGRDLCNTIVYNAPDKEIPGLVKKLNGLFIGIKAQLKKDFPKPPKV